MPKTTYPPIPLPAGKAGATKIWVLGASYSLDFFDFSQINHETDIVIGANAIACLIPVDYVVSIDKLSLPYYGLKATFKWWVTNWKGVNFFGKLFHGGKFQHLPHLIIDNYANTMKGVGGSGYYSMFWAFQIARQLKNIPEIHVCGLDFASVTFEADQKRREWQYANCLSSVTHDPKYCVPKEYVGGRFDFVRGASGSYTIQALSLYKLFQSHPTLRRFVVSYGFSDYSLSSSTRLYWKFFHTRSKEPTIYRSDRIIHLENGTTKPVLPVRRIKPKTQAERKIAAKIVPLSNRRLWIIGCGPSLDSFDKKQIGVNDLVLTVNAAIKAFPSADFHVSIDRKALGHFLQIGNPKLIIVPMLMKGHALRVKKHSQRVKVTELITARTKQANASMIEAFDIAIGLYRDQRKYQIGSIHVVGWDGAVLCSGKGEIYRYANIIHDALPAKTSILKCPSNKDNLRWGIDPALKGYSQQIGMFQSRLKNFDTPHKTVVFHGKIGFVSADSNQLEVKL